MKEFWFGCISVNHAETAPILMQFGIQKGYGLTWVIGYFFSCRKVNETAGKASNQNNNNYIRSNLKMSQTFHFLTHNNYLSAEPQSQYFFMRI